MVACLLLLLPRFAAEERACAADGGCPSASDAARVLEEEAVNPWCLSSPATFAALQSGAPLWPGGPGVVAAPYANVSADRRPGGLAAAPRRRPRRARRRQRAAQRARRRGALRTRARARGALAAPAALDGLAGAAFAYDGDLFRWRRRGGAAPARSEATTYGAFRAAARTDGRTRHFELAGADAYYSDLHYDARDNVFANLLGSKRCVLAHPAHSHELYLPADRLQPAAVWKPNLQPDFNVVPAFWHHAFDVARAADDADGDADVFVALNRFARGGGGPPVACGAAPRPGRLRPRPPRRFIAGHPSVAMGFTAYRPARRPPRTRRALSLGYRHLDTAEMYGNAGDAAALGGAADLLLLHSPHAPTAGDASARGALAARDAGLAAFVGVSNFGIRHLEELEAAGLERPAVNQVELHPWLRRDGLAAWCAANVTLAAYSPLGKARRLDGAAAARRGGRGHEPRGGRPALGPAPAAYVQTPLAFVDVRPAEAAASPASRASTTAAASATRPVVVWHAPGDYAARVPRRGHHRRRGARRGARLRGRRRVAAAGRRGAAGLRLGRGRSGRGEVYDPRAEVDEAPASSAGCSDAPETFAAARRGAELLVVAGDAFGYADEAARVYRIGRVSAGWAVDLATDGSAGTRLALASLDGWSRSSRATATRQRPPSAASADFERARLSWG
ncbi:aldo keto reductase-like protein [Aureococcus anophagefferens]|nr:aldo keto reductase-like protein [Aureococcus anophagefferens]